MPNMSLTKNPMPVQDPKVRARNFEEVALGYEEATALDEAARCLNCKNMPCVSGCPVNIRIPAFIEKVREGDFEGAYKIITESSSLPAVCGRVCPQETQCESKCVRGIKGEPVGIGRLERFVADWHNAHATASPERPAPNGHRVAVVGSGPSGLSCAGDLAKRGYAVTVFEALHVAGGVLMYGIPEFRLPKKIVRREIDTLRALGVDFETNVIIGKTLTVDQLFEKGFEAVFIGSGAGLPRFMGIPGEALKGVYSANEYLTSMDELPARREEVEHAMEEGIDFRLLTNPTRILGYQNENDRRDPKTGFVTGIECIKMELGEPDASGRRSPVEVPGSEFVLDVDAVVMSIGTSPNPLIKSTTAGLDVNRRGGIVVEETTGLTSKPGVYAGGDAVTGAATVILAMGAGKTAAAAIHASLSENA